MISLEEASCEWFLCAAASWAQVQKLILTSHKLLNPCAPMIRDSSIPRSQVETLLKDTVVRYPTVLLQQE